MCVCVCVCVVCVCVGGSSWEIRLTGLCVCTDPRGGPACYGHRPASPPPTHTFTCPTPQFGHLFARAPTREAALRAMATVLRDVVIRGEVHTIVDYALDMLQSPELMGNQVTHSGRARQGPGGGQAGAVRGGWGHALDRLVGKQFGAPPLPSSLSAYTCFALLLSPFPGGVSEGLLGQ